MPARERPKIRRALPRLWNSPPRRSVPPSTVVTPVSDEPAARRVFRPTQDVFTVKCDSYGSQNFANDDFIMVGGDKDGWVWHTLLQFDLRPISGMRVRSARLRLHPKEIYDGEEEDAEFRSLSRAGAVEGPRHRVVFAAPASRMNPIRTSSPAEPKMATMSTI